MAAEKWIGGSGVGLTWTTCMSTELNALGSGNAILASADIVNGVNLDMFADFSFNLPSAVFTGTPYIGLYLYPLNEDGTTYGDGRFNGAAAAGPPPSNYLVGVAGIVAATQAQEGFFSLPGMRAPIIIPPGTFRPVFYNSGGVALAATLNLVKYRTYNRQVT